jgi:hypothetical protein
MRLRQQCSFFPQKLKISLQGSQGCSQIHWICVAWSTKVEGLKTARKRNLLHNCDEWNFLSFRSCRFVRLNLFSFRISTGSNRGLLNMKQCGGNWTNLKRKKVLVGSWFKNRLGLQELNQCTYNVHRNAFT